MYQHDMEVIAANSSPKGFATEVIDGHDVAAVLAALDRAKATKGRPQAIVARTIKGHGVSFVAGKETGTARRFRRTSSPRPSRKSAARHRCSARSRENPTRAQSLPEAAGFSRARRAGLRGQANQSPRARPTASRSSGWAR